jgi:hypothetical protein
MNPVDKKTIKLGLIVNAAFFVLVLFAQRISSLVWNVLLTVGGYVHQGYVDRIYSNAAVGDRNLVGQATLMILLLVPAYLLVFFSLSLFPMRELSIRSPNGIRYFRAIRQGLFISFAVTAVVTYALAFVMFSISSGTTEIVASFNQRLAILAPAISDIEYKALKARWASMKSKADYDGLVSEMDNRATVLNVKLPPVRKP